MDYLIPVILAFLVGILIGWFFTRRQVREIAGNLRNLQIKVDVTQTEKQRLQSALEESKKHVRLVYAKADQLEDINGIGPAFARRLNDAGIHTFADLAAQPPERIKEIISPKNWQAIDPAGWIAQARQFVAAGEHLIRNSSQ